LAEITAAVAVMTAAFRAWTWGTYLTGLRIEGAPVRTIAALEQFRPLFFAFGVALPTTAIIIGFVAENLAAALFIFAGMCIAGAGAALKFVLVTRAGFNQGFALVHTPVRGSGVAGPAVKPGW
jgi:phenylacetyl-CoA:acceptor oxidoreductase subunit 2